MIGGLLLEHFSWHSVFWVNIPIGLLALFLGTLIGVLAGYFKKLDGPLMRLTDLFLAMPLLPLLLLFLGQSLA